MRHARARPPRRGCSPWRPCFVLRLPVLAVEGADVVSEDLRFERQDHQRTGTPSPDTGQLAAGAAAWSLVHGLATLWLNENLPHQLGNDPEEITRLVARYLNIPGAG